MLFNLKTHAQATIEYLIIIAVIVVISLIVVSMIVMNTSNFSEVASNSKAISTSIDFFAVSDLAFMDTNSVLISIKNNSGEKVLLKSMKFGNSSNLYYYSLFYNDPKTFLIKDYRNSCLCTSSDVKKSCTLVFTYLSEGGLLKTNSAIVEVPCNIAGSTDFSKVILPIQPDLVEVTPVPQYTNDSTPSYSFSSTFEGDINYGGSCTSSITTAVQGINTINLAYLDSNPFAEGTYSDCNITVFPDSGQPSQTLEITTFNVDLTPPVLTMTQPAYLANYESLSTMNYTINDNYFLDNNTELCFFNDNDSVVVVDDKSGYSNDGNWISDASYFGGLWGTNAANFSGDGKYLNFPSDLKFTSADFTISFWMKLNNYADVLTRGVPYSDQKGDLLAGFLNGKFWITFRGDSSWINGWGDYSLMTSSVIPLDEWVQITISKEDDEYKIYYGSNLEDTDISALDISDASNTHYLTTGGTFNGSSYFDGLLEDVAIWKRSLTSDEVIELNNLNRPIYNSDISNGLLALYHLDEQLTQSNVVDSSGNDNNGVRYSSALLDEGITVSTDGDYTIYTFASNGTFSVDGDLNAEITLVGGGTSPTTVTKTNVPLYNPIASCKTILDSGRSVGSGVYTVDPDGEGGSAAYSVYCDMSYDGGGWNLLMKATRGTTFRYTATYWNKFDTLNTTQVNLNDGDAKFSSFNELPITDLMARWPDINSGNKRWLENGFNYDQAPTLLPEFFSKTNLKFIQDARTSDEWSGGYFSSQTDIRFYGFNFINNRSYGLIADARWGFGWNENGEGLYVNPATLSSGGAPGSDDVSGGIGMASSYGHYSAGDKTSGCCHNYLGINRSARVEMYGRDSNSTRGTTTVLVGEGAVVSGAGGTTSKAGTSSFGSIVALGGTSSGDKGYVQIKFLTSAATNVNITTSYTPSNIGLWNTTSMLLNGSSDYVQAPDSLTTDLNNFSVSFWVKTTESRTSSNAWELPNLFGSNSSDQFTGDFGIVSNSGKPCIWNALEGVVNSSCSTSTISDDVWHMITVTKDNDSIDLYLDGYYTSNSLSANQALNNYGYWIGAQHALDGTAKYFHQGKIEEFMIWDRKLSPGEISTLYNSNSSLTPVDNLSKGLVGLWHMDDEFAGDCIIDPQCNGLSSCTASRSGLISVRGYDNNWMVRAVDKAGNVSLLSRKFLIFPRAFAKLDWGSEVDCLSDNVCLTRGNSQGLYNSILETSMYDKYSSPYDTLWYRGSYCAGLSTYHVNSPLYYTTSGGYNWSLVNTPMCVKLVSENKYYNVLFNSWTSSAQGGGFSYTRWPFEPVMGCMDSEADNYNSLATFKDGSCTYSNGKFVKEDFSSSTDCLTQNVCIARNSTQGLYNSVVEGGYNGSGPTGTEWVFGSTCADSLFFSSWFSAMSSYVGGRNPSSLVNVSGCLHLIPDNLYYNVIFKSWTRGNMSGASGGGFSYTRIPTTEIATVPEGFMLFSKSDYGSESDCIAPDVCISRGNSNGLYNAYMEGWNGSGPTNTQWYFGSYCTEGLSFTTWKSAIGSPKYYILNNPACVRVISGGVATDYDIIFKKWTSNAQGGGFGYLREINGQSTVLVYGCMDPSATNYDPSAQVDDGSCTYVMGCMDPYANNYDPLAQIDDGSCTYNQLLTGANSVAWTTVNYPSNYRDLTREWSGVYACPVGEVVKNVSFNICVESCCDYLRIYNGNHSSVLWTDNSCGTRNTGNLNSNKIAFYFYSDTYVNSSGVGNVVITCGSPI